MPYVGGRSLIPSRKVRSRTPACTWLHRVETQPDSIPVCKAAGKNSPLRSQTTRSVSKKNAFAVFPSLSFGLIKTTRQPSGSSVKTRTIVASEWSGKCFFRSCVLVFRGLCRLSTIVFRRAINAPSTGNTYDAWLAAAKALGSNEVPVCYSLVFSDFQGAHRPLATIRRFLTAAR